jgi:hypothetical protein
VVNLIWKSCALPKLKVFVWMLIMDCLNTKDIMLRKQWHVEGGPNRVLRSVHILETRHHLFFDCSYARAFWDCVQIHWDMTAPDH